MSGGAGPGTWSHPEWQHTALAWIDEQLAGKAMTRTGPPAEPRIKSWATVTAIPTNRGTYWFKAAAPATAHEIAIYPLIARIAPEAVLTPIATDSALGWLLLPDGGTSLRHLMSDDAMVEHLVRIIPQYAELQRSLMPEVSALLQLGVPDMRPAAMLQRFEEALEIARAWVEGTGTVADRLALTDIEERRSRIMEWCDHAAASPVPPSLDHGDLHTNNILFGDSSAHGDARFYDWGDSVVSHPFASLLVLLRSVQDELVAASDDPRLFRIRDAYLEPFNGTAPRAELLETVGPVCQLAKIGRSLCWAKALALDPYPPQEWASAPFEWLRSLLSDAWLD